MKVAIFGGTGFIGSAWIQHAIQNGDEIILFSRHPDQSLFGACDSVTVRSWPLEDERLEVDAVINLAGETINQRWTTGAKARILESRVSTTKRIVTDIQKGRLRTNVLINGSAVGFYGASLECTFSEKDTVTRDEADFLGRVTDAWESEAEKVLEYGVRLVKARFGVVLGREGGAFSRMVLPYRLFAGGPIGNGQQWLSWIHISDVVRLFDFCLRNDVVGPVNFTAPNPCTMNELGKIVAKTIGRPHWLPLPSFVLKGMLGEMSDLILKGQKVLPVKALEHGYTFEFPTLEGAVQQLLKE